MNDAGPGTLDLFTMATLVAMIVAMLVG